MSDLFEVLTETNDRGFYHIRVTYGDYSGVKFTLGEVWFDEDNKLCFEFDVVEGKIDRSDEVFTSLLGNYIMGLLIQEANKETNEN